MMNCSDVQPWLNLPKEEIPAPLRHPIQGHLDACPSCRQESEDYDALVLKLRALPEADPGEDYWNRFPEKIRKALAKTQREGKIPGIDRSRRLTKTWLLPLSAAAGVTALTFAAVFLFNRIELPQTALTPNEEDLVALEENLNLPIEPPLESDDIPTLMTWGNANNGTTSYYYGLQELEPEDLDHFEQQLQEYAVSS